MFIAHVFFAVAPAQRPAALDALIQEMPIVRQMKGCREFIPFLDPSDPRKLGVLHEWESADDFSLYTASPGFAEVGKILRPMMVEAPVSRRFDAQLMASVN